MADFDWLTVFLYILLVFMGWLTIYSAEYSAAHPSIFDRSMQYGVQFQWIIISLVIGVVLVLLDTNIYTTLAYPLYFLTLALLVLVLFFGKEINGAKSWFDIFGFRAQPSEIAKFATCLALAKYLSGLNVDIRHLKTKLSAFMILLAPAVLIVVQGDVGTAIVYLGLVLVLHREGLEPIFVILGISLLILTVLALLLDKYILIAGLIALAIVAAYQVRKNKQVLGLIAVVLLIASGYIFSLNYIMNEVLEPHQRERIEVFVGKSELSWNVEQSIIAIGSGGLTGKGFRQGTQNTYEFLPAKSTDFIFSTVGEEEGFIGSVILIVLFTVLMIRIVNVADRQRSKFSRIYGYGVVTIFLIHYIVNIGMTIGLAPVIGIPLPFISYGGSSLLSFTILLMIFLKLDSQRLMVLR